MAYLSYLCGAYLCGLGALIVIYLVFCRLWAKTWDITDLFVGQDNRPSTSKFQFLLWTIVIVYSYIVVFSQRAIQGYVGCIDQITPNLLTALGLSIATATVAQGITVGYVESGRVVKLDATATVPNPGNVGRNINVSNKAQKHTGWSDILKDDAGLPDLSKIQMIAWTFIAIVVYIFSLTSLVNHIPSALDSYNADITDVAKKMTFQSDD